MKVVIDPGHGGHDPGAIGIGGLRECDVNLRLGLMLAERFTDRRLTRDWDCFASLRYRARLWPEADCFVSLHANAAPDPSAHGWEIFTSRGKTGADLLARMIYSDVKAVCPRLTLRADLSDGDPDKEAGFYVLRHSPQPAVLIEVGFVTNPGDSELLKNQGFLTIQADAIAAGIKAWGAARGIA